MAYSPTDFTNVWNRITSYTPAGAIVHAVSIRQAMDDNGVNSNSYFRDFLDECIRRALLVPDLPGYGWRYRRLQ